MRLLLNRLEIAVKHLKILDEVLTQKSEEYQAMSQKIESLGEQYENFAKELYVGGKKRGRRESSYGRQMILGDLIEYIITGRGYYFALRSEENMIAFTKIIYYVVNQLLIQENISVEPTIRRVLMEKLKNCIPTQYLFEDEKQKERFEALMAYKEVVVGGKGREYELTLDSLLPKRIGTPRELLVYAFLIRRRFGFVVPLLLIQRLLGGTREIAPPDFLLIRDKGEVFGVEVGAGKEAQSRGFSVLSSIPVFLAEPSDFQPYRCERCRKWITYCDEVIEKFANGLDVSRPTYMQCSSCSRFLDGKCPDIVYHGQAKNYAGQMVTRRFHYRCVKKELSELVSEKLISPAPYIDGLEDMKL